MSDRSQFSYWGSWEQLHQTREPAKGEPDVESARALVLSGIAIKQVAANLPNGHDLIGAAHPHTHAGGVVGGLRRHSAGGRVANRNPRRSQQNRAEGVGGIDCRATGSH